MQSCARLPIALVRFYKTPTRRVANPQQVANLPHYPKYMPRLRFLLFLAALPLLAQNPPAWVAKSNRNAQLLIDIQARYNPESAGRNGVSGLDEQITVLSPDRTAAMRRDYAAARTELAARMAQETDPLVRQDLQILIDAAGRSIRASEANEKYQLSFSNVSQLVYSGLQALLDDQVAPDRRQAAVVRLRKYAGLEPGYTPITTMAEQRFVDSEKTPGRLGPSRVQLESDLRNTATFVNGIGLLLEKYKIAGSEEPFAKLREQLTSYDDWIRREVTPKARADFRLPPELYQMAREAFGVDYPGDELTRLAHQSFTEIQREMQPIAAKIAKERKLKSADYRDVIQALKKEQLTGDQILPHYEKRLAEIEDIVRRNRLITLPDRPAIIHLATAAETAQQPAPHMVPPPLLNNHGERGAFVLPLGTTGQGGEALKYDDFTFAAASWTLTAHEARPGHELQFDAMVERGVSLARGLFAFNSTNVEGWGLYAEWMMLPYMPDEGKLVSLDYRLLRAARAFLDPELQQGKITPAQAMQVLEKDVVCSKGFATEEVERFTFRSPGQAVSYFDGYTRLREIRSEAEKAMGSKFNAQRFHDFVLSQGLLPPSLLRNAVMDDFAKN
ncbi:MAG: DUF885 domain-containing protein [Bryobacterales bacterium]|nr:DUF885 domain-containing protein [Bryobacterales bacterium]MBV9398064.1 DUF885 domain-containing protein [Bryobacterales bacterium]